MKGFLSHKKIILLLAACLVFQTPARAQKAAPNLPPLPSSDTNFDGAGSANIYGQELPVQNSRSTSYILGPGDRVLVAVANVEEYSREYEVLPDGSLNLPLIGAVSVQGQTLSQASATIENRFKRYIHLPVVDLDLVAARPIQIAVAGEINRPGTYTFSEQEGVPTITSAVQLAGGITQTADVRNVKVYRLASSSNAAPLEANLWDLLTTGNLAQDIQLQDGDTLFIPVASSLDASDVTMLAEASFSPETITVNVVGEVTSPGALQVQPNIPLNQALLAAGGFNDRAASGTVDLVRLNPNGTVTKRQIEVDFSNNIDTDSNPVLRNNDTVVVARSGSAELTDTVTPYVGPLGVVIRLLDFLF